MIHYSALSQLIEDTLVARLTDANSGFGAVTSRMAQDSLIALPDLDLTPQGNQLFRAHVSIDDFLSTGNPVFPSFFVFVSQMEDEHLILGQSLGHDFSGSVTAGIEIFLSSQDEELPLGLQRLSNLYTDAMYHVFGVANIFQLNAAGLSMKGGLKTGRTRPQPDKAEGWFQAISVGIPLLFT